MAPVKLSLFGTGDDDPDEEVHIDEELAARLKEIVDGTPDLTYSEALRQGIQHVVDHPPKPWIPPGR